MTLLVLGLSAFGGGVIAALLGWADSKEPFSGRKFLRSVLLALMGGFGFAALYDTGGAELTPRDIILAGMSGAGWDNLSHRFLGAIKRPPMIKGPPNG